VSRSYKQGQLVGELIRQQEEGMQIHENENVHDTGNGEARQRKCKRLK
jgi:hypothetical protein